MEWIRAALRSVSDAVARLFGGKPSEKLLTPAAIPDVPSVPSTTQVPETADPVITLYDRAQTSVLPVLTLKAYAETVRPLIKEIERKYGIFCAIPLVQSAHESASGNSRLAREGLNLFGVTATDSWTSKGNPVISFDTKEFIGGHWITVRRGFRAYSSWMRSFEDWAGIISGLNVYKKAYAAMKTGESGIVQAFEELGKVYATDPGYARKLIRLYRSEREVLT